MFEKKKPHPISGNQPQNEPFVRQTVMGSVNKAKAEQKNEADSNIQMKAESEKASEVNPNNQRKPRKEVTGVAGKKLFVEHDSKTTPFKDYDNDGVIGHDKNTPYKGASKGQVYSFTEGSYTYKASFTKEGDFQGYFTEKPEGKTKWHDPLQYSDFDWQGNNDRLKTANYTDGGHYIGDKDYEPSYAYQEVTAEHSIKLVYHFTSAEAIEQWNDAVRETGGNMNAALGVLVGMMTLRAGPYQSLVAGFGASYFFEKLLTPQSVTLDPGGKIVFGSTMQVIRSTSENSNDSGMDMSRKMGANGVLFKYYTQFQNGSDSHSDSYDGFYGVTPYTNSMHEDFLQLFERYNGEDARTYVENPHHGLMNFVIRRSK